MRKITSLVLVIVLAFSSFTFCLTADAASTKLVAITFDDGPSGHTETLLDGLKARGAKATFFIVGDMAASRMSTVKRAVNEGHQIANHTKTHPDLTTLSVSAMKSELSACRNYLVSAAGEQRFCLRPPYGSYNKTVRNNANCPLILWSVDTLDWKYRNADTVYNNIINDTTDGSIVLLHDLYSTSVKGVLRAIDTLKERGYEFVTVNELFRRRGITLENGKVYSAAYNKGFTLPAFEAPEISVNDVRGGKQVTMTCKADVFYTTDGSAPTISSEKYSGPITLTDTTKIRAIGYAGGYGEEASKTVWIDTTAKPSISYADNKLTLKAPEGAVLYYTTDGSTPTYNSATYSAPITFTKTVNILSSSVGKKDRRMYCTLTEYGDLLIDVKADSWYYKTVGDAINKGIMNGVGEVEFDPMGGMTRAMFVTVLHRLSPDSATDYSASGFTDVKTGGWYEKAVSWAKSQGISEGVSETQFSPDENITREQMCTMLGRFITKYGYPLKSVKREDFTDRASISPWALDDVDKLYNSGLVNGMGDGTFCPKETATRAQCAKLAVDTYALIEAS